MRRLLPALVSLVLVAALFAWWSGSRPAALAPSPVTGTVPWPAGVEARYTLRWRVKEAVALPVAQGTLSDNSLELTATLRLATPDARHLRLSLEHVKTPSLRLLGADVGDAATSLNDHVAEVTLDATGAAQDFAFEQDTPPLARHLLEALARALVIERPATPSAEWSTTHVDHFGRAEATFRWADEQHLERTLQTYRELFDVTKDAQRGAHTSVQARTTLAVSPDGVPSRWAAALKLSVKGAKGDALVDALESLDLELTERHAYSPRALRLVSRAELERRPDADRAHLEARAEGLTLEQFRADLEHINGGVFADHSRWLWRVTALLQLHPELCAELVERFNQPDTTLTGRALVLDLLANAGTPEAQTAMREALDGPAARGPGSEQLLQRFSLVQKPTPESAQWMTARMHQAADPIEHVAAAASLGSMARHFSEWGDSRRAEALNHDLRADLEATSSPERRAYMVRALGNVGSTENRALLTKELAAASAEEREAAAFALRHDASAEATQALVGASRDANVDVQQTALSVLEQRPLADAALRTLTDVSGGALPQGNDHLLVSVLARYLSREDVQQALERISARNPADADLQARVKSLLLSVPASR